MPGIAEPVFTGYHGRLAGAVLAHDDVGKFPGGDGAATSDVEDTPGGAPVRQHQDVGVHYVVDVDVIADRAAVLVKRGSLVQKVAEAEYAARP